MYATAPEGSFWLVGGDSREISGSYKLQICRAPNRGHELTTWTRPSRLLWKGRHEAYVPRHHLNFLVGRMGLTRRLDFHLLRNHDWAPTINIEKLYVTHEPGYHEHALNFFQLVSRPRRDSGQVRQRCQERLGPRDRPPVPRLRQAPRQG